MIKIRNDDVILDSGGRYKGREFERFKFVHENIYASGLIHCPAILCEEIQGFPETIEYIRVETKHGRMTPYLHCWNHTDWTTKSTAEIVDMLKKSDKWFSDNLACEYYVWATPWGASSPAALEAAQEIGIRLETTHETIDVKAAAKKVQNIGTVNVLEDCTILYHWWQRGLSLFKITETAKQGSWENAKLSKPEWF